MRPYGRRCLAGRCVSGVALPEHTGSFLYDTGPRYVSCCKRRFSELYKGSHVVAAQGTYSRTRPGYKFRQAAVTRGGQLHAEHGRRRGRLYKGTRRIIHLRPTASGAAAACRGADAGQCTGSAPGPHLPYSHLCSCAGCLAYNGSCRTPCPPVPKPTDECPTWCV